MFNSINNHDSHGHHVSGLRTKYQGDDIILNIKLRDKTGAYVNLKTTYADTGNIFVYAYTNPSNLIVKGATTAPDITYVSLNYIDDYTYEFVLDSSKTLLMTPGQLKLEINFEKETSVDDITDGKHNSIAVSTSVLNLMASTIKRESNPIV